MRLFIMFNVMKVTNKQTKTKTITNTKDKFDIIPHLKVRYTPAFNVH